MAITKCINSESKQYKPVLTDKLVLDSVPTVNSLNGVTSDAVARAIAGASGEVPQVTENDNGKILTAIYDEGGPAVEWADAPSGIPDMTGNDGKILGAVDNSGTMEAQWISKPVSNVTTTDKAFTVGVNGTGMPIAVDCTNATTVNGNVTDHTVGVGSAQSMTETVTFRFNSGEDIQLWEQGSSVSKTATLTIPEDVSLTTPAGSPFEYKIGGGIVSLVMSEPSLPGPSLNVDQSIVQNGVIKAGTYTLTQSSSYILSGVLGVGVYFYPGGGGSPEFQEAMHNALVEASKNWVLSWPGVTGYNIAIPTVESELFEVTSTTKCNELYAAYTAGKAIEYVETNNGNTYRYTLDKVAVRSTYLDFFFSNTDYDYNDSSLETVHAFVIMGTASDNNSTVSKRSLRDYLGLPPISVNNANKFLQLNSSGTAVQWTEVSQMPSANGYSNKVLMADNNSAYWGNFPTELPSVTGNAGKVLAVNSGATGVEWATVQGGGGSSYTAGDGIDITSNEVSVKAGTGLEIADVSIPGATTNLVSQDILSLSGIYQVKSFAPLTSDLLSQMANGLAVTTVGTFSCGSSLLYYTALYTFSGDRLVLGSFHGGTGAIAPGTVFTFDTGDIATGQSTVTLSQVESNISDYRLGLLIYDGSSWNVSKWTVMEDPAPSSVVTATYSATTTTIQDALCVSDPLPAHSSLDAGKVLQVQNDGTLAWVTLT